MYGNQPCEIFLSLTEARSRMCIKQYKDMHKQKPKETKEEKRKKKEPIKKKEKVNNDFVNSICGKPNQISQ